jgi:hypothetical protein
MPERPRPRLTFANRSVPVPKRLTTVAIAAALVAGTAAGCGSSSSKSVSNSTTASTPAITKAAFLAKGNAICTRGNARLAAAGAKLGNHPTQAQISAYATGTFVPLIQAQISGIRALGAPPADQTTVTNMLNLAQADLDKVKSNPRLLAAGPGTFADFAKVAHAYGLKACAQTS